MNMKCILLWLHMPSVETAAIKLTKEHIKEIFENNPDIILLLVMLPLILYITILYIKPQLLSSGYHNSWEKCLLELKAILQTTMWVFSCIYKQSVIMSFKEVHAITTLHLFFHQPSTLVFHHLHLSTVAHFVAGSEISW